MVRGLWGPQCRAESKRSWDSPEQKREETDVLTLRKQKGPFLSLDVDCGSSSCAQVLLAEQVILFITSPGPACSLEKNSSFNPCNRHALPALSRFKDDSYSVIYSGLLTNEE